MTTPPPRLRLAIEDEAGMRFEQDVGLDDDLGAAKSATVQLISGDLPKVCAIVGRDAEDGLLLRFHDHPAGGIQTPDGSVDRLPLRVGTSFSLPPYRFEVLGVAEPPAPRPALPDAGPTAGGRASQRQGPLLLTTIAGGALGLGVVLTLVVVWLLREEASPRPPEPTPVETVAPTTPAPTTVVETVVERVPIADPDLVNVLIVLPRDDLEESTAAQVRTHAEELGKALDKDPEHMLLRLHLVGEAPTVTKLGHLDYARVRQALQARDDGLVERLPQTLGKAGAALGEMLGTEVADAAGPPPPWPIAMHLSDRGPGSTLRVADISEVEISIDHTFDNTELDEFPLGEHSAVDEAGLEFRSDRYRYLFTYLPVDQIPWHD